MAIFHGIPSILNVAIILLLLNLITGIILVSFFKGRLYYCSNMLSLNFISEITNKWECLNSGSDWRNKDFNFDNVWISLITLFLMDTSASWSDTMYNTINSGDIDYLPNKNPTLSISSVIWRLFFIVYMIIGSFFFLNLFVGVVISSFIQEQERIGGYD